MRLAITPQHCPAYSHGEAIPATVPRCAARPGSTPRHYATHSHTAGTAHPRKETAEPSKGDGRPFRARMGPCRDVRHAPPSPSALCGHPSHCNAIAGAVGTRGDRTSPHPLLCPVRPLISGTLESARGQTPNERPLHHHPRSRSWTNTGHAMTSRQKRDSTGRPSTPRHCAPYRHT
jgi:hypothetical protein